VDAGTRARTWGYASAVAAVAIATALGFALYPSIGLGDVGMLYLPAVMLAALAGRGPSLVAASLAVAAFDFCFVPPRYTFAFAEADHAVTFVVMFASGLAIATLTDRLRTQQTLARQADLRARSEEMRSSLLSSVSHDLRTPLAVITAAASSARDSAVPAAVRQELLSTIADEARRLERMLGNLLQLTRMETGLTPAREWVPIDELIGGALTRLERIVGDRAVRVDAPVDVAVPVDPVLFEQALINLIENAVRHGAPPITIKASRIGDKVTIEVSDRGPGIAAGDEERVFEKFYRASPAPGAGLGLAVVRGIVRAHGGDVHAVASPGGGARFIVDMPAAGVPPAAPEPEPAPKAAAA
jgi:two-component system sensor histidine kinase KdpD